MEAMAFSLSQFLGVVAGGDKDDPLLSGNMFPPVFLTPVVLRDLASSSCFEREPS